MGVVRTFQETTIFKSMTVRENVIVAHHLRSKGLASWVLSGQQQARIDEAEFGKSADDIVDFPWASGRSGTKWRRTCRKAILRALGMAIGLATHPTILCWTNPLPA